MNLTEITHALGTLLDLVGVLVVIAGIVLATIRVIDKLFTSDDTVLLQTYRRGLANSILLGLEFLVAGDIIRTVATDDLSLNRAAILGVVVLIRVILGWQFAKEANALKMNTEHK